MAKHYHAYERISENKDGRVEVCRICKKRLVIKKDKHGRMDNETYVREHVRDLAQPTGATARIFKEIYGKPKV